MNCPKGSFFIPFFFGVISSHRVGMYLLCLVVYLFTPTGFYSVAKMHLPYITPTISVRIGLLHIPLYVISSSTSTTASTTTAAIFFCHFLAGFHGILKLFNEGCICCHELYISFGERGKNVAFGYGHRFQIIQRRADGDRKIGRMEASMLYHELLLFLEFAVYGCK